MDGNIGSLAVDVGAMRRDILVMTGSVAEMNHAMRAMTVNTGVMSRDINQMGRPIDFMNSFSPW
jgi:hypothetical protein